MNTALEFLCEQSNVEGNYSTLVKHFGREYAVHYVACEIRVRPTSAYKVSSWKNSASVKSITSAVAERIAALGPAFEVAHRELYAEDLAA